MFTHDLIDCSVVIKCVYFSQNKNKNQFVVSAGVHTCGVSAAGEEAQDGRPGAKRAGHHHGHRPEGTTRDPHTITHPHNSPLLLLCHTLSYHQNLEKNLEKKQVLQVGSNSEQRL